MLVLDERGKPEYPEKNLSEQSREPTNQQILLYRIQRIKDISKKSFSWYFIGVCIINRILHARLWISHEWEKRTSEISSWTREDKIRIHKRPCDILYVWHRKIGRKSTLSSIKTANSGQRLYWSTDSLMRSWSVRKGHPEKSVESRWC